MESKKVCFKDLSWPLKNAIIAAGLVWGFCALTILLFIIGFILGIIGAIQ